MTDRSEEMHGAEAVRYAETRLRKARVDPERWEVEYVDDVSGDVWIMDYPESALQGGGSPRLRRRVEEPPRGME